MYRFLTKSGINRARHFILAIGAVFLFSGALSGCLYMAASKGIDAINHSNDNKAKAQCQKQYTDYFKQVSNINTKNAQAGLPKQHVLTMEKYCASIKTAESSKIAL